MKKPLILIVDDNVDNIAVLEELLKDMDFDYNSINDPTVILDVLEYQIPDMILLDYFMPEQDGLETIKILKNNQKFSSIPVIILTADTSSETLAKFFKEGAMDFLHKPINNIELQARINSSLKISNLNNQLKKKLSLIKKQNDEIDIYANMIFNELNRPLENISKYTNVILENENISKEDLKEYTKRIKLAYDGIAFQINNLLDTLSLMKGKDFKTSMENKFTKV